MPEPCKVFLSSTEADLGPWRDAAAEALAAIGVEVIRMEDDWAGASSPAQTCRRKLLLTRIVIALIGFHYGSEVPGDPGQRSYTQLEFDIANEAGMDLLPYVVPPKFIPDTGETGAKRDLQIAFRDRVERNHTCGRLPREEDWRDPYKVAVHLVRKVFRRCYPDASDRDLYASQLKVSRLEKLAAIADATPAVRTEIWREIDQIGVRLAGVDVAFADAERTFASLRNIVERHGNDLGGEQLARARAALDEKDFDTAQALFAELESKAKARADDAVAEAAEMAYAQGEIAEEQVRWADAAKHYARAAQLAPSYSTLIKAGVLLQRAGRSAEGIRFGEQLLALSRSENGDADPKTAIALNNLAGSYREVGRHAEAEPLYRQAIETIKAALGEAHPAYSILLNNLADLLQTIGRHAEAEPLIRQAIDLDRSTVGEGDTQYALHLNNLANLLHSTDRRVEAEPLLRQALEITRATLGEAHPHYANSLNNLGALLLHMGRHADAEPLLRQAIERKKAALGEAHPDYAKSLNNLASLMRVMGRHMDAQPLYLEALKITRAALGEAHPDYATNLNDLGGLMQDMGRWKEAISLYEKAIEIRRSSLGEAHPHYGQSLNDLALLLQAMGRHAEARPLYARAVPIARQTLGDGHRNTRAGADNYASLLRAHFPDDEALAELEAAFGPEIGGN